MDEDELVIPKVATLQHKTEHSFILGCGKCLDRPLCGGLQIYGPALSCLDHCACADPATCKFVCPRNPALYAKRMAEVNGFQLTDIEKRSTLPFPDLPEFIPVMYRSLRLERPVDLDLVAIPFSEMYRRKGKLAVPHTRQELEAKFRLRADTKIVLTGVEHDCHVEQWWGSVGRRDVVRGLRDLGVVCATTPNFSLMTDVPRHDNMHAIKRIALIWGQLHDAGVPTALHLNGRTDHDFLRFREFLQAHNEIEAIAFEFTTGAANKDRGQYFSELLIGLANEIKRPLTLILRGGLAWASVLAPHFGRIVLLDTDGFHRTVNRRRATVIPGNRLHWQKNPTPKGFPLDELLAHNLEVVRAWVCERRQVRDLAKPSRPVVRSPAKSQLEPDTHDESPQIRLL